MANPETHIVHIPDDRFPRRKFHGIVNLKTEELILPNHQRASDVTLHSFQSDHTEVPVLRDHESIHLESRGDIFVQDADTMNKTIHPFSDN